jgi:Protein of unknown function (DUF2283)
VPVLTSYVYFRNADVARTVEVNESATVDVDAEDRVIGVEIVGDDNWGGVLAVLAMQGRLVIPKPVKED